MSNWMDNVTVTKINLGKRPLTLRAKIFLRYHTVDIICVMATLLGIFLVAFLIRVIYLSHMAYVDRHQSILDQYDGSCVEPNFQVYGRSMLECHDAAGQAYLCDPTNTGGCVTLPLVSPPFPAAFLPKPARN